MTDPIYVTRTDLQTIRNLLREAENTVYRGSVYIQKLKAELERACVIAPQNVPDDLITLNTTAVLLDASTGERTELTLVMPEQADLSQGKISVLAPIGAAMLGYSTGNVFAWDTPGGKRTLKVEKVIR